MEWLWCTERKKWSVWNRVIYSTLIYFDIIGGSIVLKWFVNRKFCSCTYGFQDRRIWITTFRRMWDGNIRKSGGRQIRGWSIGGVFVFISEFEFFGDITFFGLLFGIHGMDCFKYWRNHISGLGQRMIGMTTMIRGCKKGDSITDGESCNVLQDGTRKKPQEDQGHGLHARFNLGKLGWTSLQEAGNGGKRKN